MFAWRIVGRQRDEGAVELGVTSGDRAERLVCVLGQRGEVVASLCDRAKALRALDEELAQRLLVAGQLGEQRGRRLQAGSEVLVGLARLLVVARVDRAPGPG